MSMPSTHCICDMYTADPLPAPHELSVSDVKSTSVRVSWQAVENADRYTVTLSQTMGDNELGLCPEASHIVSINTSNLSAVVGRTDSDMLRAYTTYSITVVAESDVMGRSQHSDPVAIATEQTSNASLIVILSLSSCLFSLKMRRYLLTMCQQQL